MHSRGTYLPVFITFSLKSLIVFQKFNYLHRTLPSGSFLSISVCSRWPTTSPALPPSPAGPRPVRLSCESHLNSIPFSRTLRSSRSQRRCPWVGCRSNIPLWGRKRAMLTHPAVEALPSHRVKWSLLYIHAARLLRSTSVHDLPLLLWLRTF